MWSDNQIRCFAINQFSAGDHPFADEDTVQFFKDAYVRECLAKLAACQLVEPKTAQRARELAEIKEGEIA